MKRTIIALFSFVLLTMCSVPKENNPDALDLRSEYYDFDYLKEESVERLRVAQWKIQATAAYEFAVPIAGYAAWWKGFLAEAEYGDWLLYDSYDQKVSGPKY